MFDDLRNFCLGVASIIATALMLTLLDRRNRRYVQAPIFLLACAGFFFHSGVFFHALLEGANGVWAHPLKWLMATAATFGLACMPSGLLHAVLRIRFEDDEPRPSWYRWLYLPLICVVPASAWLWRDLGGPFLLNLRPLVYPFVIWMIAAALTAVWALMWFRRQTTSSLYQKAAPRIAASLLLVATVMIVAFGGFGRDYLVANPNSFIVLCGLPLLPAIVFGYLVIRHNLMRLTFEQTVVYGAILVVALLLHQLTLVQINESLRARLGIDIAVLEGAVAVAIALMYRPLRQRISESLRYLMGTRVFALRENSQRLAVELSTRTDDDPTQLLGWFVPQIREMLDIPFAVGRFTDEQASPLITSGAHELLDSTLEDFATCLCQHERDVCSRGTAPEPRLIDTMSEYGVDTLIRTTRESPAIFALGARQFGPSLTEEERNAAKLLAEQFAVTLQNRALHQRALVIERQAMQNEKLRTLGMLSSCMAHEVKNPLSTIRTIATVMREELGEASGHAEDLRLMIGEVDRLTTRTNELLGFARPAEGGGRCESIGRVIEATVDFLGHNARKHGVNIDFQLADSLPCMPVDENALRDVLFNLIGNSVEAARSQVRVDCKSDVNYVVVQIVDDGPGIEPGMRDRLFDPFVTTKANGTGLGLYIVKRRIEELGGQIELLTQPDQGTTFTVRFPR